ncbi:dTDP-4-dehydrorhamnose reductase [Nostoc sp. NIES-4103]|nr:dTDP-4-dehydrorhamnose reductase [Nostoc sp. NIES-4103]
MKILLTGVTGQVGWELQRTLMPLGTVIPVGRRHMDLAQPDTIRHIIRELRPDLIVNPAAYLASDKAESEPDLAMAINGIAPGVMAEEAKRLGAAMIHYSTAGVFDGTKNTPYKEEDKAEPPNIYGKTKLAGEQAIAAVGVDHLIFRINWVYGLQQREKNFLMTMLRLAEEQEEIRVVDDQFGAPTWSRMIAEVTAQIVFQSLHNTADFFASKGGLYHLTASGKTSWYGFSKAIFEYDFQWSQRKLKRLIPITTQEYPTTARRLAYSILDNHKLSNTFKMVMPDWQNILELVLAPSYCP